jgi:uncharacterized protein with von Willebrand factor type A (vWA) domain
VVLEAAQVDMAAPMAATQVAVAGDLVILAVMAHLTPLEIMAPAAAAAESCLELVEQALHNQDNMASAVVLAAVGAPATHLLHQDQQVVAEVHREQQLPHTMVTNLLGPAEVAVGVHREVTVVLTRHLNPHIISGLAQPAVKQ